MNFILGIKFDTRYQVSFYLWRIKPKQKRRKFSKLFLFSKPSMMITVSEKSPLLIQKRRFYAKTTNNQS